MTTTSKAFSRLTHLDIPLLQSKHVTIIGLGGGMAAFLAMARQGIGRFTLIDFDVVEEHNIGRQDHDTADLGMPKVQAAKQKMQRILPSVEVTTHARNFCDFPEAELLELVRDSDLVYVAVDRHPPVALANQLCLRTGTSFIVAGMYAGGQAGELYFWHPGLLPCHRCVLAGRYASDVEEIVASDAASFSDCAKLDSAGTDLALGLLTFPDTNPLSEQIKAFGNRNFLQMKFRHSYQWEGRDIIAESLGIPPGNDAYVTYCCAARRDPDGGGRCPDCQHYRALDSEGLPQLDNAWTQHLLEWKPS